jgi:hypothetical protein
MRKRSTARSRTEVPKPGRAPGRPAGTDGVGGGCPDSTRRRTGPYVATTYVLVSSRREKPPPLAGGGETRQAPPPEESEGEAWKGGGEERARASPRRAMPAEPAAGRACPSPCSALPLTAPLLVPARRSEREWSGRGISCPCPFRLVYATRGISSDASAGKHPRSFSPALTHPPVFFALSTRAGPTRDSAVIVGSPCAVNAPTQSDK